MRATVRLVLLTAIRDRLFSGIVGLILLSGGLSLFLSSAVIVEQSETGAVYAAGAARFILIFGLTVFIAFQTQRLFESREIEGILSRSLSRTKFVVSYWLGFSGAALVMSLPIVAILFALYGLSLGTIAWSASLLLEALVVIAFAQFAAMTLERATSTIFVTTAFYAFCRLIGFFLGIRDATPDVGANLWVNPMIDALALVIPRLDLMTQTSWFVYGFESMKFVSLVLVQSVVFIAMALGACAIDLRNKQF